MGKLIAVVVLVLVGWFAYGAVAWRWEVPARFEQPMLALTLTDFAPGEGSVGEDEKPYRTGKVFIMKPATGSQEVMGSYRPPIVEQSYYYLASALQARQPEEVETLVFVMPGADVKQHRSGDWILQTRQKGVTLTVYDMKRKIRVGDAFVIADQDGSCARRVAEYIESMPTKE